MKTMTIYLAGPIDDIPEPEARRWRNELALGAPTGCLFFNPTTAWSGASQMTAQALDYGNRVAIVAADGLLANLSGPGWGFGTIREIEFARSQKKPVAVALGDRDPVSLLLHDVAVAVDVDAALGSLVEMIRRNQDKPPALFQLFSWGNQDDE